MLEILFTPTNGSILFNAQALPYMVIPSAAHPHEDGVGAKVDALHVVRLHERRIIRGK